MAAFSPNLDWITDKLAVGGSFEARHVETLARELRVRAVIDVRSEDCDDEELLQRHGVDFLHLPTEDHCAVSQAMLDDGSSFALERLRRGERVLIHCREGIGRSVTLALCVLVLERFSPLDAMRLTKARRYYASPSPAQFEAWSEWLRRHGVQPPSFEDFAAIAYRHVAGP